MCNKLEELVLELGSSNIIWHALACLAVNQSQANRVSTNEDQHSVFMVLIGSNLKGMMHI